MSTVITRRSLLAVVSGLLAAPALSLTWPAGAGAQSPVASPGPSDPLAALLQTGIDQGIPGLSLLVERDGQQPVTLTAGVGSLERGTPVATTDRFRIYSITKAFTAIVTLQLVDEGTLTLDDPVTKWLVDPAVAKIPNIDLITVRQLLNHTSGIYDYFDDNSPFLLDAFLGPEADWSRVWTPQELLAYADGAQAQPYSAPGGSPHYSNTNYILVGMIVEQVTGKRFGEELQSRILEPLALTETYLELDEAGAGATVDGYQLLDGDLVNLSSTNTSWAWTAGGMVSTVRDLARFAEAAFAGTLLSPQSFAEMFALTALAEQPNVSEGMGVFHAQTPSGEVLLMDGESAGFSAVLCRLPDAELTVIVLANMAPGGQPFETLRDDLIQTALQTS